ncbi:MAG: thermonuclease family protein [Candidatus Paceibacterota bacterium]
MENWLILVLICILFISGCGADAPDGKILSLNKVVSVIDGDTLVLATGEHVRMLHINAPEKGERCYSEASEKLKELVLGKEIFLERDMQDKDKYNRSLRYVYLDNESAESVNEMIVEGGFAVSYILLPNTKHKDRIIYAEEGAIEGKRGCLWQNQSEFRGCIKITELKSCDEGDYVVLANICEDIDLSGWSMQDASRSRYSFSGIIEKNSAIKITRDGWDTTHECIWSDYINALYMFDNNGWLALKYGYSKGF